MLKIFACLVIVFIACAKGEEFSYENPESWKETFPTCDGKLQSPIDIDVTKVVPAVFPPLQFVRFDKAVKSMNLTNNGHTIQLVVDSKSAPSVAGGPLKTSYVFDQFHFHWGPTNKPGSENAVSHKFYPSELHMVFWNSAYGTKENALTHPDGLTVLAFFIDLSKKDNQEWNKLLTLIPYVKKYKGVTKVSSIPTFLSLLPSDFHNYYTYPGSLTTPPCSEIVTWIEFKTPITFSKSQLAHFRKIQDKNGQPITRNYRPTQPKNNRPVLSVSAYPNLDKNPLPPAVPPFKPYY